MTKNKFTLSFLISASLAASPLLASAFQESLPEDTPPAPIAQAAQIPTTYEQWQQFFQGTSDLSDLSDINPVTYAEGLALYKKLNKAQEWFDQARAFAVKVSSFDPNLSYDTWQTVFLCADTLWPEKVPFSVSGHVELVSQDARTHRAACIAYARGLINYNYKNALVQQKCAESGMDMTTARLLQAFVTAYAKRAVNNGIYPLDQARFIAEVLLSTHTSSLSWCTTRTTNWDLDLLKDIAERTPDLLPHDKALLKSHVALLDEDFRLFYGKKPQGRALYEKIIRDLKPFETQDPSCMSLFDPATYYAHLAKAYYGLKNGKDCIKAWDVAHSLYGPDSFMGNRYLEDAMRHLSVYCKSPHIHEKFWRTFLEKSGLTTHHFQPTFFEIEVLSLPTAPSQWVELNDEYVTFLQSLVAFLRGPGTALNTPQSHIKYEYALHISALRLARLYVLQKKYKEASEIYNHYFEIKDNTLYMTHHMRRICDTHRLTRADQTNCLHSASVSFVNTGRFLISTKVAKSMEKLKAATPSRGKAKVNKTSRATSSTTAAHPASQARTHLIDHYTNRIDEMAQSLETMGKKLQKTQNITIAQKAKTLLGLLGTLKERILAQPTDLTEVASSDQNLPHLGKQIDALTQVFGKIMADYVAVLDAHKEKERKDFAAHLETLKGLESSLTSFELPQKAVVAPTPVKTKVKTRGKANTRFAASSATSLSVSSPSAPTPSAPRAPLFFGAQAKKDYGVLPEALQEKFHGYADEIATNPYGILGTLGRAERLTGLNGTFFARKLTDGDRVVYEVVKGKDGVVRVIFIGLLGHYKHLARQVAGQSAIPFEDISSASSSSSSSSSSASSSSQVED